MKIKMMFRLLAVLYTALIILAVNEIYSLQTNNVKVTQVSEVQLHLSDNSLRKEINSNISFLYTLMFIIIIVSLLTYLAVDKKILQPVDKMRKTILAYEDGENDIEEFASNNDEIGLMIKEFFAMKQILDEDHAELSKLSFIDSLTGAFNREAFFEIAEKQFTLAMRNNKPFSIIIFDVDSFVNVNNDYGHLIGDEVLKDLVNNITRLIRASDLFARFSGEEFILMLPDTDELGAASLAGKVRVSVEEKPFKHENSTIPITVSVGVSSLKEVTSLHDLIHKASDALAIAKERGKNKVEVN